MRDVQLLFISFILAGCAEMGGRDNGPPGQLSECVTHCDHVITADCRNGPEGDDCETTCEDTLAGSCSEAYEAWLICAGDSAVSCDAAGIPQAFGCDDLHDDFMDCTLAP